MAYPEHNACRCCPSTWDCLIQNPQSSDGSYALFYETCIIRACPDGLRAARDAVHSQQFETLSLPDRTPIEAARFGTPDKPTHEGFPARYCDVDGNIYVGDLEHVRPTGQVVRALKFKK